MYDSLLREVTRKQVERKFRPILNGNAVLTAFNFFYRLPLEDNMSPVEFSFEVTPEIIPSSNIHAIIGKNGVGKSRCFRLMVRALCEANSENTGEFMFQDVGNCEQIANVVFVAFSAFDPFEFPIETSSKNRMCRFDYIGLAQSKRNTDTVSLKTFEELKDEFAKSLIACRANPRHDRWVSVIKYLLDDPVFNEFEIIDMIDYKELPNSIERLHSIFNKLSSGHKIILLTLTRLVELVDEQTLVLIDEPEAHLHPPLLSAFMRALSFLLITRNGISIIATHSPVVLQETPANCVWIMSRAGKNVAIRRPTDETFGSSVGSLTRDVFGLEVTNTGFSRMIQEMCQSCSGYNELIDELNDHLGLEGRALARAYFSQKTLNVANDDGDSEQ